MNKPQLMNRGSERRLTFNGPMGAGLLLVAATVLAYAPVFRAGFVWDDDFLVTANPLVTSPAGLRDIWFSTRPVDYFPLTLSSLWLEWKLWGMNATGYHVTNVLLHAISAVVLWRLLRRLAIPGAWWAALLFALHPVNVESVAWIAQRKNTLCMVFFLLSVWAYVRYAQSRSRVEGRGSKAALASTSVESRRSALDYFLALVFFTLALLSKTAVVLLPVVLLLCEWWMRTRGAELPTSTSKRRTLNAEYVASNAGHGPVKKQSLPRIESAGITGRDALRVVPLFALSGIFALITVWFQYHQAIGEHEVNPSGLAARVAGIGWAVGFYLYKAVLPLNLAFVYPRWQINPASLTAWLPNLALVGCWVGLWRCRHGRGRAPFFALSYFVLMLFPVLGLFNIYYQRYSLVADHWQYFSIIGVIALGVGAPAAGLKNRRGGRSAWGVWAFRFEAGLLALVLGVLTWRQASLYRDAETLWRDTLRKNPEAWLAHNNLGILLGARGELEGAESHFLEAARIEPRYAEAHCNLGIVHARRGRFDAAIAAYEEALRLRPDYAEAHNNLGVVRLDQGQTAQAIEHFARAISSKPDYREAHQNLALALARHGKPQEAVAHVERAIALGAPAALLHRVLADGFAAQKQPDRALTHYRHALAAAPEFTDALNNLAWLLATCLDAQVRDGAEAVRLAERAAELTRRSDPHVLGTLAAAYAEAGRFEEAASTVQRAMELAEARGQKELAAAQRAHLECYLAKRPYREP